MAFADDINLAGTGQSDGNETEILLGNVTIFLKNPEIRRFFD